MEVDSCVRVHGGLGIPDKSEASLALDLAKGGCKDVVSYLRDQKDSVSDEVETLTAESSSSPSRFISSSPRSESMMNYSDASRFASRAAEQTLDSNPTTLASDDDEQEGMPTMRKAQKSRQGLTSHMLLSDDDASEDDEGLEEDGLAFLARFRQHQAEKQAVILAKEGRQLDSSVFSGSLSDVPSSSRLSRPDASISGQIRSSSSAFSGSLSDPPTMDSQQLPTSDASSRDNDQTSLTAAKQRVVRPIYNKFLEDEEDHSTSSSPRGRVSRKRLDSSSPDTDQTDSQQNNQLYRTEAQKTAVDRSKRADRLSKLQSLAARARQETTATEKEKSLSAEEDPVSSGSEGEGEGQALVSHGKKAVEKKGGSHHSINRRGGKSHKQNVLHMEVDDDDEDDDDSGLSDMNVESMSTVDKDALPKPLSKKELEEMSRMQARIEREKRTMLAKEARVQRERKTFGIQDLIANIGATENARRGLHMRQDVEVKRFDRSLSPFSDPIETSSSEAENMGERKKDAARVPKSKSMIKKQPFYVRIKEKYPPNASIEADHDDEIVFSDHANDKSLRLYEAKRTALRAAAAAAATTATTSSSDPVHLQNYSTELKSRSTPAEDDIEFYDANARAKKSNGKEASSLDPESIAVSFTGSPTGMNEHSAHSPQPLEFDQHSEAIEGDSDEGQVTMSQLHRAGRVLAKQIRDADAKPSTMVKVDATTVAGPSKEKRLVEKSAKPALSRQDFQRHLMQQIAKQNIQERKKKDALYGRKDQHVSVDASVAAATTQDLQSMLETLRKGAAEVGVEAKTVSDEEDANDSDFDPEADEHSDVDLGSGAEDGSSVDPEEKHAIHAPSYADESAEESNVGFRGGEVVVESITDVDSPVIAPASPEQVKGKQSKRMRVVVEDEDDDNDKPTENSSPRLPELLMQSREPERIASSLVGDFPSPKVLEGADSSDLAEFFVATPEPESHRSDQGNDVNATLGQFFEDTQPNAPLRGESFPVLPLANEGQELGFTQLFEQGTQVEDMPLSSTTKDRALMPPPVTSAKGLFLDHGSDYDGFAALRQAQANDAMMLDDEPADLPALEDLLMPHEEDELAALELEAMRAEEEDRLARMVKERAENSVMYINKDGFFTQTRPESFTYSFTQSQSQDQSQEDDALVEDKIAEEDEQRASRRRRFRRAVSLDEEEQGGELDSEMHVREELGKPSEEISKEGRTAFDILKEASRIQAQQPNDVDRAAARRFVQGEAEESDGESEADAIEGQKKKRKSERGGLEGVFSDDEGGSDEEEDEDDEDDGRDLEGLIDEEREHDEADKDVLARERYQLDMEEDDRAALALHERAVRGAFRNKRRARNHEDGALEGFLEEDFEDDWLERVARNPYGNIAKKRRLEGKDGMDLLAEKEESQAFVREYHDAHVDSYEMDNYNFLVAADDSDNDDESPAVLHDLNTLPTGNINHGSDADDDDDDDDDAHERSSASSTPPPSHRITRQQIQEEVAARRRAKRQQARLHVLDDEFEAEEERKRAREEDERERELQRNIERALYNLSDDDDDDDDEKREKEATSYVGKGGRSNFASAEGEDAEANDSFGLPVMKSKFTSDREKQRLLRLAKDYEHEPDWKSAKEAIQRNRPSHASRTTTSSTSNGTPSSTSTSLQASNMNTGGMASRITSRLRGVLSRRNQFTESQ